MGLFGTPRNLFATHRGRLVRRSVGIAAALSAALWFGSALVTSGAASTTPAPAASPLLRQDHDGVVVSAAPANPFAANIAAQRRQEHQGTDAFFGRTAPTDESDAYRAVTRIAQTFALAYGSYSYQQDPRAWAAALPHVGDAVHAELTAQAVQTWPQLRQERVVARARMGVEAPQVFTLDTNPTAGTGTATVGVEIVQEVSGSQGTRTRSKTYVVTLHRAPAPDAAADPQQWVITGVRTG